MRFVISAAFLVRKMKLPTRFSRRVEINDFQLSYYAWICVCVMEEEEDRVVKDSVCI